MKKWFLSHDGDVTGPLTIEDAIEQLKKQPNSYGWHPSFSHWLPVSQIGEFADKVEQPSSPAVIPQAMLDEFISLRKELLSNLEGMDENVKYSKTYLYELEQEINIYKRLTNKLSDEVKNNIGSIEVKYNGYLKVFEELIQALDIAKSELSTVSTEFDKRYEARSNEEIAAPVVTKAIAPTPALDAAEEPAITPDTLVREDEADNSVKVELDPVATPVKSASLDPVATKGNVSNVSEIRPRQASLDPQPIRPSASMDNVAVRLKPGESIDDYAPKKSQEKIDDNQFSDAQDLDKQDVVAKAEEQEDVKAVITAETKDEVSAKLQGVTSLFKSVFRGDKKVEPKQEVKIESSPVSLAHSNDEIDDDHDDDHDDDEPIVRNGTTGESSEDKQSRMRRRSRRRR